MSQIDVIIPCYQYGRFLRQCVGTVLSQPGVDVRVLIIDDASNDDTPEIGRDLAIADRRVHFLRHTTNIRHIATFNEGLAWASAKYTLLLSADDLLTPGCLRRAVNLLEAHPEVGMVYGKAIFFQSDDPALPEPNTTALECPWKVLPGLSVIEAFCNDGCNFVSTPTVVVRTELQKLLGGYHPQLTHSGDMEMWMRFAAHSDIGLLDADQAYYRIHSSNMSLGYFQEMTRTRFVPAMADLKQKKAAFDMFFESKSSMLKEPQRLQQMAARGLAWDSFWGASHVFEQGNASLCNAMLDFALEVDPSLQQEPEWARLRWKRRVGPKLWSALRPVIQRVRHRRPSVQPV